MVRIGKKSVVFWLVASGLYLCACDRFISPRVTVLGNKPCVMTMSFSDGLGSEISHSSYIDGHKTYLRPEWATNWYLEKFALHDVSGNLICTGGGNEFAERYRNAPSKFPADYAVVISQNGERWISEREFLKLKKELDRKIKGTDSIKESSFP